MTKIIPDILKDHILPFDWDICKAWEPSADVIEVPTSEFVYLLKLSLWSSVPKQGLLFDSCPMDVIHDPHASLYQAQKLQQTERRYPIDVLTAQGRRWILDGVHKIAKSFTLNKSALVVWFHDESVISTIKKPIHRFVPLVT